MSNEQLIEGGSDTWKYGSLIRRMKPVRIATIGAAGDVTTGVQAVRVTLRGLVSALTAHIACALVTNNLQSPIRVDGYPAVPGTIQLTPVIRNPELPPIFLRPVFQDPTSTTNANVPLPQNIPFGWSFESEGVDDVEMDISFDADDYQTESDTEATLIVAVTLEYTGTWIDPVAFSRAIGKPTLIGPSQVVNIHNGVG